MGKRKSRKRKEEIAEDFCFVCKDGGQMRICDFGDCLKTYHAECVEQDASFLTDNNNWCCGAHYCYLCTRASKFMCLCCPNAVCGNCFYAAEFATVKRNKGFCDYCSKLAFLIEKNADVDSDGEPVDMKDPAKGESYFLEYYKGIKKQEDLTAHQVYIARDIIKNGKNKCDLDLYEIGEGEDDSGESDVSDYISSDMRRKRKCVRKKGKLLKDKKTDFVGWASRSLIDFLENIGRDTTEPLSEIDVASIIIDYCNKNSLFDPNKKKKIICDPKLNGLLRRKTVNKNSIQNLLESHFAANVEETDDISSGSEEIDNVEAIKFPKQKNLNSAAESCQSVVSEARPSGFVAVISPNIKLVYLKRSLIEELLKQPETFDGKVLGGFVRTKSDPNDYLQKNSHLLLQVVGINRSRKEEINQDIFLRLSNVPKDVPINKLSDDDFSEEECQDLYQRMTDGLLKKPTILEFEQKARTLHEDIMKHWISREIALLRNRIDLANEKGWRRELAQYMDRKQKLESPLEQSRLLSEIPKVIPEMVNTNMSPENSSRKDKLEQNDLPELAIGETCSSVEQYSTHDGFAQCLDNRTDVLGPKTPVKNNQDDTAFPAAAEQLSVHTDSQDRDTSPKNLVQYALRSRDHINPALFKESNSDSQTLSPAKCGLPQLSNTLSADVDCRNLSDNVDANQVVKERQSVTVADPGKAAIVDVIVLSDSDEEDVDIKVTSVGRKGLETESPDINSWYCSGIYGSETRGPFSMSALKLWSESDFSSPFEFKVWKTGESEREAMPLRDALKLFFP